MSDHSRSPATTSSAPPSGNASSASPLMSSQGRTHIASVVVSKIAGLAAREIAGVHALGGGAARVVGTIRERIPGATSNVSRGVRVEVGEKQAAVDLDVVVEYGVAITDVAAAVRRNVIDALQRTTGLEVVEVNIAVNDVFIPSEEETRPVEPRVTGARPRTRLSPHSSPIYACGRRCRPRPRRSRCPPTPSALRPPPPPPSRAGPRCRSSSSTCWWSATCAR
jgi:uncharacterized alkaline shock family protein YloU